MSPAVAPLPRGLFLRRRRADRKIKTIRTRRISIALRRLRCGTRTLWLSSMKAPKIFSFDRYGAGRPQHPLACSQRPLRISPGLWSRAILRHSACKSPFPARQAKPWLTAKREMSGETAINVGTAQARPRDQIWGKALDERTVRVQAMTGRYKIRAPIPVRGVEKEIKDRRRDADAPDNALELAILVAVIRVAAQYPLCRLPPDRKWHRTASAC